MFSITTVKIENTDKTKTIECNVNDILSVEQIIKELIESKFLPANGIYRLLHDKSGILLDANDILSVCSVKDGDILRVVKCGEIPKEKEIAMRFVHPMDFSNFDIEVPENTVLQDVINYLIEKGFLLKGTPYRGILRPNQKKGGSIDLQNQKTIKENGINDNDIIQIMADLF